MINFLIRKGKYLDLLFDQDGAKLVVEKFIELLESHEVKRSVEIYKFDEKAANKCTLHLSLGNDDCIEIKSDSISLILDRETCGYAVAKLNAFISSGSIFPAELQSFDASGNKGDVMVYFLWLTPV